MRGEGERKGRRQWRENERQRWRSGRCEVEVREVRGGGKFEYLYVSTSSSVYFTSSVDILLGLVL